MQARANMANQNLQEAIGNAVADMTILEIVALPLLRLH